ncbi:MAG: aminotransferase class V-fold PLP-dependent enzyme [Planctomycetota bacterium]|nr:MAG: aminotransferase class V-fold PLP-dependent enzyme [Planctomycetota bacterium]
MTTPALAGLALDPRGIAGALEALAAWPAHANLDDAARDEEFWQVVSQGFTPDRSMLNLNNGGVCPSPRVVQEAVKRYLDHANTAPAYVLWQLQEPQKETVRQELAQLSGVDAEEIAITRNASEGLETCLFGFDLERGDQILTTHYDYPRMLTTIEQRVRRDGVELVKIDLPLPLSDAAPVVRAFEAAITPRTKLILVSHVVFLTGQVLPVAEVVALGRKHGIPVIVDGAHAFAHLDFKISDIDCDYYGVSLHKWLFAPHGSGLLYVRRDKIRALWPLMAANATQDADIRKFEEIGTHPAANFLAIADALAFHRGIGGARKLARMLYLRNRWAKRLSSNPRVRLKTSLAPGWASGVANFAVDGMDMAKFQGWLWTKHRIFTVYIGKIDGRDTVEGLRISPCVYTLPADIDRFCDAVEQGIRTELAT